MLMYKMGDVACSGRGLEALGSAVVWTLQHFLCCAQLQVADQRGADLLVLSADAVHDKSVDANLLAVSLTHCKVRLGRLRHKSVHAEALMKGGTIVVAAYSTGRDQLTCAYHAATRCTLRLCLLQEFVPCPMLVLP